MTLWLKVWILLQCQTCALPNYKLSLHNWAVIPPRLGTVYNSMTCLVFEYVAIHGNKDMLKWSNVFLLTQHDLFSVGASWTGLLLICPVMIHCMVHFWTSLTESLECHRDVASYLVSPSPHKLVCQIASFISMLCLVMIDWNECTLSMHAKSKFHPPLVV